MATAAQVGRRRFQKAGLRRRMRVMTIETTFFSQHRPVQAVLRENIVDQVVVTPAAQFKTLFLKRERVRGGRTFMTEVAAFARKGLMGRVINEPGPVRTVHAVSDGAP